MPKTISNANDQSQIIVMREDPTTFPIFDDIGKLVTLFFDEIIAQTWHEKTVINLLESAMEENYLSTNVSKEFSKIWQPAQLYIEDYQMKGLESANEFAENVADEYFREKIIKITRSDSYGQILKSVAKVCGKDSATERDFLTSWSKYMAMSPLIVEKNNQIF